MSNEYTEHLQKLQKFNRWETEYLKKLPVEKKMWQFIQLYRLKEYLPEATVRRAHEEHLANLIRVQKIFREMNEKMKRE